MTINPQPMQRRKNLRLNEFDYSQPGGYFVTLVAWQRECLFGKVVGDGVDLNEFGRIIQEEWIRSAEIRHEIEIGNFVIMPNHFHGIVILHEVLVGATGRSPLPKPAIPNGPKPASVGALIAGFKSACTTRINRIRHTPGDPVWQRGYYDHILRDEADWDRINRYIEDNPRRWSEDDENPSNQ